MTNQVRMSMLLLALLPGGWACGRAPYRYQAPAAATLTPATADSQLLFLSFRMAAPATGIHQVELLRAQAVPGTLPADPAEEVGTSYLLISQLDAKRQPCGPALRLAHPLLLEVEAPSADQRTLQRQQALRPEAEFFVRLARQPQAQAVRVEEVGPLAPTPAIVVFPLNL
jgi:hypothetical protein